MVVSLHMGWRHVCFANWPVEPTVVDAAIPDTLTLDIHNGTAWLSVVPFTNVDVRPRILPSGSGIPLPEMNLRTYVSYRDEPGVYFFSLDADRILAVLGARLLHHLPYFFASVDFEEEAEKEGEGEEDHAEGEYEKEIGKIAEEVGDRRGRYRFESRRRHPGARPARFAATYEPMGERFLAEEGSLERFLTDRRRLYTEGTDGGLRHTDVSHREWPLFEADVTVEENTLFAASGFESPDSEPVFLYSPGVDTVAAPSTRTR